MIYRINVGSYAFQNGQNYFELEPLSACKCQVYVAYGSLIWLALGEEYRYCCFTSLNCSMADVLCIRGSL